MRPMCADDFAYIGVCLVFSGSHFGIPVVSTVPVYEKKKLITKFLINKHYRHISEYISCHEKIFGIWHR